MPDSKDRDDDLDATTTHLEESKTPTRRPDIDDSSTTLEFSNNSEKVIKLVRPSDEQD